MNWLQVLGPSLLMVMGGLITWIIKSKIEELRSIEEKLLEDRRKIYQQILEPFIIVFSGLKSNGTKKAIEKITSFEYKKTGFNLNLFGSDAVVKAYNNLMQHSFQVEKTGEQNPKEMMHLFGNLLLEIRKSLGNKKSKLEDIDMLRSMVKDIDSL